MDRLEEIEAYLQQLLGGITAKERDVLERRFGIKLSEPPNAHDFESLTPEQAEALERAAIEKLKREGGK